MLSGLTQRRPIATRVFRVAVLVHALPALLMAPARTELVLWHAHGTPHAHCLELEALDHWDARHVHEHDQESGDPCVGNESDGELTASHAEAAAVMRVNQLGPVRPPGRAAALHHFVLVRPPLPTNAEPVGVTSPRPAWPAMPAIRGPDPLSTLLTSSHALLL